MSYQSLFKIVLRLFVAGLFLTSFWTSHKVSAQPAAANGGTRATGITIPPDRAEPVRIPLFEKPPVIDGRLDDEAWAGAVVLKDFFQIQPGDNIPPSKPTEVLLGYDSKHLYIAFRAFDEPDKVQSTVARRDNIFNDDYIGMFLDTYNDQRNAFVMFFNPLGIQADGTMTESRGEDYSVDILMESKGTITSDGYIVEVAIPFKSLRYHAGKDKLWGAHFLRRIKRFNNELNSWMPISRNQTGLLNQAGRLTGLEEIATERTLELIPSLTLSQTGRRVRTVPGSVLRANPGMTDPGRFVNEPIEIDPGLTAKLGITPTVTLDLALNPDFAQVEADQIVVTTNQRFPIFFPERRPFFLEGIDIFQSSLQPVHTRAIIDPDFAVKLSGKLGRNTFGIMAASDNAPGDFSRDERNNPDILPRIERFLDKNAYIGVLRLKRDIGKESDIGFTATTYNFIERHNDVAGFDGRFVIDPQTIFSFQALGTTSRRFFFDPFVGEPIYRTGNAFGYTWIYDVTKRNYGYFIGGTGRTRDYRADVGFTQRTNTNRTNFAFRYSNDPKPKATFIGWRLTNFTHINYDFQGRMQIWETEVQAIFNFAKQTYVGGGYERAYERLFEEEFGRVRTATRTGAFFGVDPERSSYKHHFFFYTGTRPSQQFFIDYFTNYRVGHFDFDFGAGPHYPRVSPAALLNPSNPLDPGPGNLLELGFSAAYQPTPPLRFTMSYTKNRLVRHDTGLTAFDVNLVTLRGTYQFTPFTFVRARVDYNSIQSNLKGQFLFGWTPNPGTTFYVGYNDDVNRSGFSPFTGQLEPGFRRNGRTFFLKMSYLFRRSL